MKGIYLSTIFYGIWQLQIKRCNCVLLITNTLTDKHMDRFITRKLLVEITDGEWYCFCWKPLSIYSSLVQNLIHRWLIINYHPNYTSTWRTTLSIISKVLWNFPLETNIPELRLNKYFSLILNKNWQVY